MVCSRVVIFVDVISELFLPETGGELSAACTGTLATAVVLVLVLTVLVSTCSSSHSGGGFGSPASPRASGETF